MTYVNVKARKIQEVQIRTGEGFSHKKALDFQRYRGYREENKKFTRPVHNNHFFPKRSVLTTGDNHTAVSGRLL